MVTNAPYVAGDRTTGKRLVDRPGRDAPPAGVINQRRRRVLIGASVSVWGLGFVGAAVPFIRSWTPSGKARAFGGPVKVDISKLVQGMMLGPIPAWRGLPIFVLRRTQAMIANLRSDTTPLSDPASDRTEQQPAYAKNATRSRMPEIGVYIGLCTHLSCIPRLHLDGIAALAPTAGGFFCQCHGSKYDLAGRVYKNVPAPANLAVPPYSFESDSVIILGVDEQHM